MLMLLTIVFSAVGQVAIFSKMDPAHVIFQLIKITIILKALAPSGQMVCNTSLFGSDLCVDIEVPGIKAHATLACEMEFNSSKRNFDDVVKNETPAQKALLDETFDSAKKVCTGGPYVSLNYGLCDTLKEKLKASLSDNARTEQAGDQQFINNLDTIEPADMEKTLQGAGTSWEEFHKDCFDEKNTFKNTPDCLSRIGPVTETLKRIENTSEKATQSLPKGTTPVECELSYLSCSQTIRASA